MRFKLLGFRWGPTPTPRKRHGGEGAAARCSQAPKLPRYLTWRAHRLFVGSRGCTDIVPGEDYSEGQERAWRPWPPRNLHGGTTVTSRRQRFTSTHLAPARFRTRSQQGKRAGLFLAQNSRSFLIHTRSFTVTGWGHVFLKQRLGPSWLIFIGLPSFTGGERSFLNSFSRTILGFEGDGAFGVASTAHAVQSSRNSHQAGSTATLQGTRHTRRCYRPARMTARPQDLSKIPAGFRLPASASRTGSARKARYRRDPRLCGLTG